jgi:hypothetical protein
MKFTHRLLRIGMRTIGRLSDGVRLGFATGFDSGTMVDYVYANRAHGITPLGTLIDRVMLDHVVWRGVRARRALLVRQLRDVLATHGPDTTLFDVAAGPGSYLFELPVGRLFAGDIDPDEVEAGRARAARDARPDIAFARADAFDETTWPARPVGVLVASGFFDILVDDADVARLLAAGTRAAAEDATWVFTVMEAHPNLALLRDVLVDFHGRPWEAVTRSAERVLEMARPLGWRATRVEREPNGLFAVATMVRGAALPDAGRAGTGALVSSEVGP